PDSRPAVIFNARNLIHHEHTLMVSVKMSWVKSCSLPSIEPVFPTIRPLSTCMIYDDKPPSPTLSISALVGHSLTNTLPAPRAATSVMTDNKSILGGPRWS